MVDYNGLENRRTERYRGFESLSLRKSLLKEISEGFFHYHPIESYKPVVRAHPINQGESFYFSRKFYTFAS